MLRPSSHLLRRKGNGHVVKYLEGVPTPSKLIDHIAGADLHASAQLPFFNTVPRYVDTQRERRLSKLFFHHVLYPAGGARLPYQAVVVRGGRAVQTSIPRVWHGHRPTVPSSVPSPTSPARSVSARANPLAVPAAQLTSSPAAAAASSLAAPSADVASSAAWARLDPARRPFFSAQLPHANRKANAHRNTHAETGPAATNPYLPRSLAKPAETLQTSRAVEDDVLKPLRGVVEQYWNAQKASDAGAGIVDQLQKLWVRPSAGLLWMAESGAQTPAHSSAAAPNASTMSLWETLMKSIQCGVAEHTRQHAQPQPQQQQREGRNTFAYVQTHLPPVAAVLMPVENMNEDANSNKSRMASSTSSSSVLSENQSFAEDASLLCRMAGGLEPAVPFAVGRPLSSSSPSSPAEALFPHISCLTRVNVCVAAPPAPAATAVPSSATSYPHATPAAEQRSSQTLRPAASSPLKQSSAEPWKLGGDGLDLMIPQHARTVAEHHPGKRQGHRGPSQPSPSPLSATAGRYVLGRRDAETYLIPQRELLLTLYVPAHTADMCAAQNEERLRRQVRAGRASPSSAAVGMAWSAQHTRMTAERRAMGQYANTESARVAGTTTVEEATRATAASAAAASPEVLVSRASYEVRALPGDVVYIPRGWGYDVQRILGTATIHHGAGSPAPGTDSANCPRYDFRNHRELGGQKRLSQLQQQQQRNRSEATQASSLESSTGVSDDVRVVSVEVDALCLNYYPYPELTAAQADVYVAANYVHTGVEEFYEKGGNSVFRSYQ